MVVPVLMISCQVSENPNRGPDTAQITSTSNAATNAIDVPAASETRIANRSNARRSMI